MRAFVVLGLFFSIPSQDIGLGKRLRNDLFCVEWGVKPPLNQSILSSVNRHCLHMFIVYKYRYNRQCTACHY